VVAAERRRVTPRSVEGDRGAFPPWLQPHLAGLLALVQSDQAPPGLLVVGPEGVGKGVLVRTFLQRVACTRGTAEIFPCGACNGCRSFLGASHPEILEVVPEEAGKEILVDQVRAVIDFLSLSHAGPARLVFIEPAEAMNVNAANALLKTLEEPPPGAMVLLAAARPARLPPTIRSRCRRLRIPSPDPNLVRRWLEPMEGRALTTSEALAASLNRPLEARALLGDDDAAEAWRKDQQALAALVNDASPFPVIDHFTHCDLQSLLPRLQRLLLSLQTHLATDRWDDFAQLFECAALARFAGKRGARELARLYQDSLQWQRDLPAPLNPQSRCEHIVLRFWRHGT
jgi:DNA polymerase III subunit delta'